MIEAAGRLFFERKKYSNTAELAEIGLETISQEAGLALHFLERWGMVQADAAGEDSAGRAKLELMPVAETVERAIDMAALCTARFRELGWMVPNPAMEFIKKNLAE